MPTQTLVNRGSGNDPTKCPRCQLPVHTKTLETTLVKLLLHLSDANEWNNMDFFLWIVLSNPGPWFGYEYRIYLKILLNTLRPRRNMRHFTDDIFKCIFLNENVWISIKTSLKFVPKGSFNIIPALVEITAWRIHASLGLNELRYMCSCVTISVLFCFHKRVFIVPVYSCNRYSTELLLCSIRTDNW